jgi:hypothetical protein
MPDAPNDLSVIELERLLKVRKSRLDDLLRRRDRLQSQLGKLDEEIADLSGDRQHVPVRSRRGPRIKNERSLREYVVEILGRSKKGLTLAELAQKVLDAGYKSDSANFRNVLYQCVYNTKDLYHDESTGTYRMKSVVAREMKKQGLDQE